MKISNKIIRELEREGYRIVGKHSAVKICPWTKKSLRGEDVCWKEKFYGIKSHKCCQMSCTLFSCQNECIHCWRNLKYTCFGKIKNPDSPYKIIKDCIESQRKLLSGFKGSKKTDMEKFKESLEPSLFTFSLLREPTLYPKLAELIKEVRKNNAISFLITNGLNPEKIKELERKKALPTQLTLSVNAPNEKIYEKICRSCKENSWKKFNETLTLISKLRCRTVARLTLIKDLNMKKEYVEQYTKLIKKANPLFVHVKGYACRGYSKKRLKYKNMPTHKEIIEFSKNLLEFLPDFKFLDDKFESRVVLLGKDKSRMKIKDEEV